MSRGAHTDTAKRQDMAKFLLAHLHQSRFDQIHGAEIVRFELILHYRSSLV